MTYCVGDSAEKFTIELYHGGFFVGYGQLKTYVDERITWFDHCEANTWSVLWFEDFIKQLGYRRPVELKIYWLLPGKDLSDGLRIILNDADTNAMTSVVHKVKNLVVYIDHEDTVGRVSWDDVISNPVAELPKVISPVKVHYTERQQGETLPEFYKNLRKAKEVEDEGGAAWEGATSFGDEDAEDEDFMDSENEIEDGDEDLFWDNVDDDVIDQGVAKGRKIPRNKAVIFELGDEISTDEEGLDSLEVDGG